MHTQQRDRTNEQPRHQRGRRPLPRHTDTHTHTHPKETVTVSSRRRTRDQRTSGSSFVRAPANSCCSLQKKLRGAVSGQLALPGGAGGWWGLTSTGVKSKSGFLQHWRRGKVSTRTKFDHTQPVKSHHAATCGGDANCSTHTHTDTCLGCCCFSDCLHLIPGPSE